MCIGNVDCMQLNLSGFVILGSHRDDLFLCKLGRQPLELLLL